MPHKFFLSSLPEPRCYTMRANLSLDGFCNFLFTSPRRLLRLNTSFGVHRKRVGPQENVNDLQQIVMFFRYEFYRTNIIRVQRKPNIFLPIIIS